MGPNGAPYVNPDQIPLPAATLNLATDSQKLQACLDASEQADSYMRGRYALPLLAWGNDITRNTGYIAAFLLMQFIGYAPQAGSDQNVLGNLYLATGYPDRAGTGFFPGIQAQRVHPDVTPAVAQPGDPGHDVPQVFTSQQRGWNQRFGRPRIG